MTPQECRERRQAVGLSPRDLARRAGLMLEAVKRFEAGGLLPMISRNKLSRALEKAGLDLANGGKAEAKLQKATR